MILPPIRMYCGGLGTTNGITKCVRSKSFNFYARLRFLIAERSKQDIFLWPYTVSNSGRELLPAWVKQTTGTKKKKFQTNVAAYLRPSIHTKLPPVSMPHKNAYKLYCSVHWYTLNIISNARRPYPR